MHVPLGTRKGDPLKKKSLTPCPVCVYLLAVCTFITKTFWDNENKTDKKERKKRKTNEKTISQTENREKKERKKR